MCEQDKIHLHLKGLEAPLNLACTMNADTGKAFEDLDTLCTYVVRYETIVSRASRRLVVFGDRMATGYGKTGSPSFKMTPTWVEAHQWAP